MRRQAKRQKRQEALSVNRLIHEVLVAQLGIPFRQIVNDTAFTKYTGNMRADILISESEYDGTNDDVFIQNLLAYAEAKDNCAVDDSQWKDAIRRGKTKANKLGLPYFIVTNCKTAYFYNAKTLQQLTLNGNPIREFQTIDIYRLIKRALLNNPDMCVIDSNANVDSRAQISEALFNKKLWELANVYRNINFKNNTQKIDFTIGFVALEYFEEKQNRNGNHDASKVYWSACNDKVAEKVKNNLSGYIKRLKKETTFKEFAAVMDVVQYAIDGDDKNNPLIKVGDVKQIYEIIDSMRPLHGTGFDLFGAVYEMFASAKEKKDFGEYFTRRHYTHIFAKLLLTGEDVYNPNNMFSIIDPACGTGGFLTESFKVLAKQYENSGTLTKEAKTFLSKHCFYGIDVREENISRTRLNMFLVGDGHTHMYADNSLAPTTKVGKKTLKNKYRYVITNPPYGRGTIKAQTSQISTSRYEIAFICKVIDLLEIGGKACIIVPDGVLENPSYKKFRNEILEQCDIYAIISLPKFAFAPYTKEKTYALFIKKRSEYNKKIQETPVWMYIIDNDGLANSDKRFPTRLRNTSGSWLHDELSGWVTPSGVQMVGLLEKRWLQFDDLHIEGTQWVNDKGIWECQKKGGNIPITTITNDDYYTLLPEYYIRPYEPSYLDKNELISGLTETQQIFDNINIKGILNNVNNLNLSYTKYQAKEVPISSVVAYMSGNANLTEEFIYQAMQHEGKRYNVLSSATEDNNSMGQIPMCQINNKPLKVFEGKEGLLVARNGKAGTTRYLPKGQYTINDHAYILYIRDDSPYQIDLRWLAIQYKSDFLSFVSNADNGTWNMTGFFKQVKIDIPEIEEQRKIINIYNEMADVYQTSTKLKESLELLLDKQIFTT